MNRYLIRITKGLAVLVLAATFPAFAADPDSPSLETLRKAAEQGSADAQYELGILYEFGFNFPDHKAAAYAWYSKAAEQGNAIAAKRRDVVKGQLSSAELDRANTLIKPPVPPTSVSSTPPAGDTEQR